LHQGRKRRVTAQACSQPPTKNSCSYVRAGANCQLRAIDQEAEGKAPHEFDGDDTYKFANPEFQSGSTGPRLAGQVATLLWPDGQRIAPSVVQAAAGITDEPLPELERRA